MRGLCATVVPLAGLLAETGLTLREDEVGHLRTLAATDPRGARADAAVGRPSSATSRASELTVEIRRDLLDRLGMYGVRFALARD